MNLWATELSIIILNYNTPHDVIICIDSLYRSYTKELKSSKYEVVLVDNKSTNDSVNRIQSEIKNRKWKVAFIKANKNSGFGNGCNLGAMRAKGKYLLFLNPDTVLKDNSISKMLSYIEEHSDISILGGRMINRTGVSRKEGGIFPNFYHSTMMFLGLGQNIFMKFVSKPSKVDWVGGGCMLIKKRLFDILHGFDQNIFMYLEDVEICYRARKMEYQVFYYPYTKIIHLEGKSSNNNFKITNTYKSYLYFCKKHKGKFEFMIVNFLFRLKFKIYYFYGVMAQNKDFIEIYSQI